MYSTEGAAEDLKIFSQHGFEINKAISNKCCLDEVMVDLVYKQPS